MSDTYSKRSDTYKRAVKLCSTPVEKTALHVYITIAGANMRRRAGYELYTPVVDTHSGGVNGFKQREDAAKLVDYNYRMGKFIWDTATKQHKQNK